MQKSFDAVWDETVVASRKKPDDEVLENSCLLCTYKTPFRKASKENNPKSKQKVNRYLEAEDTRETCLIS